MRTAHVLLGVSLAVSVNAVLAEHLVSGFHSPGRGGATTSTGSAAMTASLAAEWLGCRPGLACSLRAYMADAASLCLWTYLQARNDTQGPFRDRA